MPYLTHPSGQKTFYYDDCFADRWSTTEVILIHHGFGRNSEFWYKWVPVLAQKYRVIRRDALGHGYSSPPPKDNPPQDLDRVLDEIADTLDQLKIEKVHYLGESTGGIFGELFAARYPDRLISLTVVGSPLAYGPAGQQLLTFDKPTLNNAIRELGIRGWGRKCAKVIGTEDAAKQTPGLLEWWLDVFAIPTVDGVCAYSDLICRRDFDCNLVIDKIKVPMLLLSPARSPLVDVDDQKRLAKATGGRLEFIDTAAHEIYLFNYKECQERFMEFLGSL